MKKCFEFPSKIRYNTEKDAETAVFLCEAAGRPKLFYYHCASCNGWHLTSKSKL